MSDSSQHDALLKTLSVSPGKLSPGFSSERKAYTVYVLHATGSIRLTAETRSAGAGLTVNGAAAQTGHATELQELQVGRNLIHVDVTAPDGETKDRYVVKTVRLHPTPSWVQAAATNAWSPRDSAGELVFRDRMWLFGGYTPGLVSDVWSSSDGVSWEQVGSIPCPSGINIPVALVHDDKMWIASKDGRFFCSEDGANWSLVSERVPWGGRYAAGGVAFDGRMWVMGGCGDGGLHNDIWSSVDGVDWTLEVPEAPWSKRQLFSGLVVLDDRIWLIGGGVTNYHPFRAYRDVWNSRNGKDWDKVTDCAPWPVRIWSSCAVYRDRLWLFSGFRAEPTWNNFDDVWYSSDGVHWNQLVSESVWSERHEVSPYVFDGKLWVVGGNSWPLVNDAWYLEIPGLTFTSQPVIEEFVGAQYSYQAHADFNESRQPVRYRLIESPDWLSIGAATGLVQGTPPREEDTPVTIEAYDGAGETASQSYTLQALPVG